jgi:hydrogenase large subunit
VAEKVVIDPVTRLEGHLKIEAEIEDGKVKDAWSTASMARGFEILLKGKDPRDAQVVCERICGVCPAAHGMAASQNLDSAFRATTPANARIIRNLIVGANYIQSHILHFYHLQALDYLDIMAVAEYSGNDPSLSTVKDKIVKLVQSDDTHPLTPRYEPDEFSVNDPDIVTLAVSHYLQALEMRKKAHTMLAIFGGRMPSYVSSVPGGVTVHPTLDQIAAFKGYLKEFVDIENDDKGFIKDVYYTDVLTLATGPLLPLGTLGIGKAQGNFMSFGMFDLEKSGDYTNRFLPSGVIYNGELADVLDFNPDKLTEDVKYSWYEEDNGGLHPSEGKTQYDLDKKGAYSFGKAPRYNRKPVEVGPLARMLIKKDKTLLDLAVKHNIEPTGALARTAARAIECLLVAKAMHEWLDELTQNLKAGVRDVCDDKDVPETGVGRGLVEAPRGSLGHFIEIEGKRIKNYQAVPATIWNASPRDAKGVRGPIEEALIGTPVPDAKNPNNIVRVIRSFDP